MTQHCNGKLLNGYAGLKHTAKKIAEFIPKCELYVEAFCGQASVAKYVQADKIILNDMSEFIWKKYGLQSRLDKVIEYTKEDFEICIKRHDSPKTFFLIDPIWRSEHYTNHSKAFMDRKPSEYYKKISELIQNMTGDWIVCGVANKSQQSQAQRLLYANPNFHTKIVIGKGTMFGKHARTSLVSNRSFN
jgi:site-specific DNA-adenine methylase